MNPLYINLNINSAQHAAEPPAVGPHGHKIKNAQPVAVTNWKMIKTNPW
jgi:hypothetical protein